MYQKCPGDRGARSARRRLKGFRRCEEGIPGAEIAPAALGAGCENDPQLRCRPPPRRTVVVAKESLNSRDYGSEPRGLMMVAMPLAALWAGGSSKEEIP